MTPVQRPAHTFFRSLALAAMVIYGVLAVVGLYGFWVEPYWLEVSHHTLDSPLKGPLRIVQVSDLHSRGLGAREERVLEELHRLKPDAIVVSGDYIAAPAEWIAVGEVLRRMEAPLGVWVVRGNWEVAIPVERNTSPPETEQEFYRKRGLRFLLNESAPLRDDLWIVGFDDDLRGKPEVDEALKGIPPGVFRLGVFHSPTLFDRLEGRVDLGLAGHTHGGQIRLPGARPLYLPPGSGGYRDGWYVKGSSRMYVSRGVGTTFVHFRLFCRPELAVIDLQPPAGAPPSK